MAEITPRITATYLEPFLNRTVRIVGKVTQLRGDTAVLDTSPSSSSSSSSGGGRVDIHLNRDSHLTLNSAVEIVGKVQGDLSVRVLQATDWGTAIDFAAVEAVVDATHRHREIFYGDADG